uniref:Uncharacterized protein n=1 Tax=Mycobacterium sp. (strain JLS) TaxID=164757 RepID=A0A5Q5CCD4_MYCSJ
MSVGSEALIMWCHCKVHVVPLQDLVQHDAVNESAEAEAEQERGKRVGWACVSHGFA